jgi:hypothetical protein
MKGRHHSSSSYQAEVPGIRHSVREGSRRQVSLVLEDTCNPMLPLYSQGPSSATSPQLPTCPQPDVSPLVLPGCPLCGHGILRGDSSHVGISTVTVIYC